MNIRVETLDYKDTAPWDLVGAEVTPKANPSQVLKRAKLDWTVEKIPAFVQLGKEQVEIDRSALVRADDNHILSVVSKDWNPLQNIEAFEFFEDFIKAGNMEMHAAGSLKKGELVWALAKVDDSFSLFEGEDVIQSYLLFTNPHRFGKSIDIRLLPTRLLNQTSLSISLTHASITQARVSHRVKFDALAVKDTLDIAHEKMDQYREAAELLASKRITNDQFVDYLNTVFPVLSQIEESQRDMSRLGRMAYDISKTMPGNEVGHGTWWEAFNAVTYTIDYLAGRNVDNRLESAWFGAGKDTKARAIDIAIDQLSR